MLLARNGQIQTFVLCDGPKIIGYSLWITSFDLMFAHHNRADEVALYVMPEYRGRPSIRLMRYAEMRLRDMGYTRLARAAKKDSKLHTTLLGLGYGKEEIIVFKEF
jgi:GNAT superfamily N-acetyltransferase